MITGRILPRDEWPRLAGTEMEALWPHLPADAQVIVVEDGDRIVGTWSVYRQYHVHGAWTHPDYRKNPRVGRRLLAGMFNTAQAMGAQTVHSSALDAEVAGILEKLGAVELPGRHFSLGVRT